MFLSKPWPLSHPMTVLCVLMLVLVSFPTVILQSSKLSILVQQLFSKMLPNATPTKLNTSLFNLHLPLTLAFGHSHTPISFYLICRVNSPGPGQGTTSYAVSFIPPHTGVHLDQRHFQILLPLLNS